MKHLTLSGILIIYLTLPFLSGCSKVERHEQILTQMQREMKALQKNNLNADRRNEELKNTLSIFDSKMERNNQAITELRDAVLSKGIPEIQTGEVKEEPRKSEKTSAFSNVVKDTKKTTTKKSKAELVVKPEELYKTAFDEFNSGNYKQAILKFRRFVKDFPRHEYADNSLYWLGEVYYSQKDFSKAIIEFKKVHTEYPNGNKVPDALLKIGLSYINLRDFRNAEDYLQKVLDMYPFSDAARKADMGLRKMEKK